MLGRRPRVEAPATPTEEPGVAADVEQGERRAAGRDGLNRLVSELGAALDAEQSERRAADCDFF